jgi:hypothetical protein
LKLDSVVTVIDPDSGKQLARNDDASASDRDAAVDFTAPSGGAVEVQISDLVGGFGHGHAYSVTMAEVQPAVSLRLAADRYALAPGGEVELPITVQRQDGYDQMLSIAAEDLPEGVRCEVMKSEPKGDSAKQVKLKLIADESARHQGPIRIVAREGEAAESAVAVASFPISEGFALRTLWLSVGK